MKGCGILMEILSTIIVICLMCNNGYGEYVWWVLLMLPVNLYFTNHWFGDGKDK